MIDDDLVAGMLGYTAKDEESYRGRFRVLEQAGVVVRPDRKAGTPLRITDAATFREPSELGVVFEETLLLYAQEAAGSAIGIPHFTFNQPTESHEIDFALYESAGHKDRTNWERTILEQSLCVFEVTCGHLPDVGAGMEEPSGDSARSRPQTYGASDHPHKKLVNFLSLRSLRFANLQFHYLSILPLPDDGLSHATKRALRNTDGFSYWCLADEVGDINTQILNLEDKLVPVATLRDWHTRIIERVCQNARDFASRCATAPAPSTRATP